MKLIYSDASPYARTARVFVRELGLLGTVEEIALHPFDNPGALIEANPLCKVPCLLTKQGDSLFDSQVICEYLDSLANQQLFKNQIADWQVKTLYSLTRGLMDSAVAWQQDKMRAEMASEFWQQRFSSSMDRGLQYLEKRLEPAREFTALDINLICLLDYLSFRHPEYHWKGQNPQLNADYKKLSKRSSFIDTRPQ